MFKLSRELATAEDRAAADEGGSLAELDLGGCGSLVAVAPLEIVVDSGSVAVDVVAVVAARMGLSWEVVAVS